MTSILHENDIITQTQWSNINKLVFIYKNVYIKQLNNNIKH